MKEAFCPNLLTSDPQSPVESVLQQFAEIADPPNTRSPWTASRIGFYADRTFVPILTVLAQEKFGPFDPSHFMAFWKDKDFRNETWSNVGLVERSAGDMKRRNPYGVPSGTKEYWKKYRDAKREKIRAYQKSSRDRRKALLTAAEHAEHAEHADIPDSEIAALLTPKSD